MAFKDKKKQTEYLHQHYLDNKQEYLDARTRLIARNKEIVVRIKSEGKCKHCEERDPACLDFHHTNPQTKETTIARAMRTMGERRLLEEIGKCELLCSNCHRRLHKT